MKTPERTDTIIKEWEKDGLKFYIMSMMWADRIKEGVYGLHDYHCGYVVFPECPASNEDDAAMIMMIDVHGGITWNREVEGEGYVYGFDCGHYGDENDPYLRDVDWLTRECESMGRQIVEATGRKVAEPDGE